MRVPCVPGGCTRAPCATTINRRTLCLYTYLCMFLSETHPREVSPNADSCAAQRKGCHRKGPCGAHTAGKWSGSWFRRGLGETAADSSGGNQAPHGPHRMEPNKNKSQNKKSGRNHFFFGRNHFLFGRNHFFLVETTFFLVETTYKKLVETILNHFKPL